MIHINERLTCKLPGITSLFVSFDYDSEIVEKLKTISDSYYDAENKEWEIPITSLAEFVDSQCQKHTIELEVLQQHSEPDIHYQLMDYSTRPFQHQLDGIQHGLNHPCWLLLDSPGLGKTLQLTYLAEELKLREGLEHCLIICGINSLKTNWKMEIEKHSSLSCKILGQRVNRKGKLVVDGVAERVKQLKEPIEEFFVITNVETLRSPEVIAAILKNKHNTFDMIVVDEIHKMKSPQSIQGKHLLKLNKSRYRIGATGTLLLNDPLDTYIPLKWIGAERSTYSKFRYYYCNYGGPFGNMLVGFKNISVLQDQIAKYSLRRTKDILQLPPKNIINEYVDMSPAQETFYDNIKNGVVAEADKVRLHAGNLLALVTRLRQATACPSILTSQPIPSAKIERAQDLAEQIVGSGSKVVIFSTFKETVKELAYRLESNGVVVATGDQKDFEIEDAKQRFQTDPNTKIFIGTWQKCGTGITLTAATYLIFIDTPFTAAETLQAEDRIHRIGSSIPVFVYRLITKDTFDERVLELIEDKELLSEYIVDGNHSPQLLTRLQSMIEDLTV